MGEPVILSSSDFAKLAQLNMSPGDGLFETASEKLLIANESDQSPLQLLALRLRTRMSFLQAATALHIFVVTLRCEHSCPYCQVSRRGVSDGSFDMTAEVASQAIDIALSSPSPLIKIEFQGGEPLLNFDLIQLIVHEAKTKAEIRSKKLEFVIATNLALLSDEVLDFCREHNVMLSTSLDGPADLHNRNRPRPGNNSYELAVSGIRRVQDVLGPDRVSALMTTTQASLNRVVDIVDEYLKLNLDGIFLRSLSPYGFAKKTRWYDGYDSTAWLKFYEEGLRHIIEVNKSGRRFVEFYASLLLQRMMTDSPTGYVDLRSPAGIGLGALVYNYDGKVFASDEARMLAEMGDRTFEIGSIQGSTYKSLMLSDVLVEAIATSLTQTAPQCADCVFEPVCGSDPVYHHATQGDVLGHKALSSFCDRQMSICKLLLRILDEDREDAKVLKSWISPW